MCTHQFGARVGRALFISLALHAAQVQALTIEEAQQLAEKAQPLLESRRAAIVAAREASVAARQLPDPKLRLGVLNLPIEGPEAYTLGQDFMTMRMVGVMQEFPRRAKRDLRGETLQLEAQRGERELAFSRLQVRRDAALAWLDAWTAVRAVELVQAQQTEAATQVDALVIALRNNRASAADVSAARVELELLGDKQRMLRGEERAARAMLSRWIGGRSDEALPESLPDLRAPDSAEALLRHLDSHPHLSAFDTQVQMATADAQLADLSRRPDWSVELSYARRGSQFSDMVSLQVGIDLPIFQTNRQDRSVAARLSQAQAAREMREDNLREMRADVLRLFAAWEVGAARTESFRERIVPQARLRLEAALAAYRSGKSSLLEVLSARRTLLEVELEHLMRRAETARAAIALHYFSHPAGERQ